MAKLSIDQALLKAKLHAKNGEKFKAESLYNAILKSFPKNKRAKRGLAALDEAQSLEAPENLLNESINHLIALYDQGQLANVVKQAQTKTEEYPDSFMIWNILGAANKGLGRVSDALKAFQKVTLLNPYFSDGFNNLGAIYQEQGNLDQALAAYKQALLLNSNYPEAYNNMGNALRDQGKYEEAIRAYENSLSLRPNFAVAYKNLGDVLREQSKFEEAVTAYYKAIALNKDYFEVYNNMGILFQDQEKLGPAIEAYKKALLINPNYVQAHNNMGNILKQQGRIEDAIKAFASAISLKPDYAEAHNNMGNALREQGRLDDAIKAFITSISFKPDYVAAYNNMGTALNDQGKLGEALEAFNTALVLEPDSAFTHNNIGNVLQHQGKLDRARDAYRNAILCKPEYAEAHRHLSEMVKYKPGDLQINQVKQLIGRPSLNDKDRCQLHYAFAKMKTDLGDYENAFKQYALGGALREKLLSYELEKDERLFTQIKNTAPKFKAISLKKMSNDLDNIPIFILGMPRSGTTLIEQIVSSHSQVCGAGELLFLERFGRNLTEGIQKVSFDNVVKVRERYLSELKKISRKKRFVTDKMPHNFLQIGLILTIFPEAKIIHVKRDPAATCWSIFKHFFPTEGLGFSYNLRNTVNYYKMYQALMDFWDDFSENQIYHLDYDEMTSQQEAETKRLIKHLGLSWEDSCLSPQENKRVVKTASQQQVRKKVYKNSSKTWLNFEPYLNGVLDEF